MELKKSKKADLERNRGVLLQIGLLLALSVTLIAFDYSSKPDKTSTDKVFTEATFDVEEIQSTIRKELKSEPIRQIPIIEILDIVDNGEIIDVDIDFGNEATPDTRFNIDNFDDPPENIIETDFVIVEDMPTFNGGDPRIEFRKYIANNLQYPEIAAINGVGGKVLVKFVINKKGFVVDAVILNSVDPALDKEALRVVNSSPPWVPGKQRGKPVRVIYTFPIGFVLKN